MTGFNEFVRENWITLLATIGTIIAWFRREIADAIISKPKVEANNIENLDKTIHIYKDLLDDIIVRYEVSLKDYQSELKKRDEEIVELRRRINVLTTRVKDLEKLLKNK